jgi:hypothetical protein
VYPSHRCDEEEVLKLSSGEVLMLFRSLYRTAAVFTILSVFVGLAAAQKTAEPSRFFKATVAIDSYALVRQKSAIVTLTIENISGRETKIKSICSFALSGTTDEAIARDFSAAGDSYWSQVYLPNGPPLQLDSKPAIQGFLPEVVLHFNKDEIMTFEVDLTKLLWNDSIRGDWPRWNLFEVVPKGRYALKFRIHSGGLLESNEVKVTVE